MSKNLERLLQNYPFRQGLFHISDMGPDITNHIPFLYTFR